MRFRLRHVVSTVVFVILVAAIWLYFAPSTIGGSTHYVVTSGISMEPRFHSGDLALVRPDGQYRVGEIVAYRSTLLHVTVLHRIVAIHGNHYTFKGDNNNFIDPVRPTRNDMLGKLWLHVPRVGRVLGLMQTPVVAAVLCAVFGGLLLLGFKTDSRRRRRRRQDANGSVRQGLTIMDSPRDPGGAHFINFGAILTAAACAVAVFFVLGVFAFVRPASEPSSALTTYSQSVRFGYSAHVAPGPVYPTGAVSTGDPIFLTLVHRLGIHVDYGLTSQASSGLSGTEKVVLTLAAPNGWSRSFVLTPSTHFTGGHTSTDVTLDLTDLQSLLVRIGRLTDTGFASFSIHVVPRIDISGIVGGHPVKTRFDSGLTFALANGELQPSAGAGSSTANLSVSKSANVSSPRIAPASITVLGVSAEISLLRWIAILGLLVSGAAAVFFYLRKRAEPFQETAHIQSHFGHMIVPIVAGEDLGWPAVDVPTIKALVRLAESGQRLILHSRANDVDTYMVNDEGTVYRYQVKPSKVVWGEWSTPAADLEEAASEIARVAADAAPSASSAA